MIELASHHFATINVIATQAKIISLDNHWVKGVICCNLGVKVTAANFQRVHPRKIKSV